MKAFVFALLIFSLMIGFVVYNYFEINSLSDRLIGSVESLPPPGTPECRAACLKIQNFWNESRDFVSFSCGITRLDTIEDLVDSLVLYSETELYADFELTRIRLINAVEGIAEFESFRAEDIF